jgi:hypothetical protein
MSRYGQRLGDDPWVVGCGTTEGSTSPWTPLVGDFSRRGVDERLVPLPDFPRSYALGSARACRCPCGVGGWPSNTLGWLQVPAEDKAAHELFEWLVGRGRARRAGQAHRDGCGHVCQATVFRSTPAPRAMARTPSPAPGQPQISAVRSPRLPIGHGHLLRGRRLRPGSEGGARWGGGRS